jgi:lipopolysaccharide/colanic/teichoic acid biosynthesis glycosyltransferase
MYKHFLKRFIDFLFSLTILLFLFPILLLIAIIIKLTSPGPIFFMQERVGRGGNLFKIYKFRTMIVNKNREIIQTFENDPEITMIGKILRRLKVDEIPQLINVFWGDMALIGPRPALPLLYKKYNYVELQKRLSVRPGMTGWAQIHGNIFLSWEERLKYDSYYVEHLSFLLDIRIIVKTVAVVLFGEQKFIKK